MNTFDEYITISRCSLCESFCYPCDLISGKYIDNGYALCSVHKEDKNVIQKLSSNYKKLWLSDFDYCDRIPYWCDEYNLKKLYK